MLIFRRENIDGYWRDESPSLFCSDYAFWHDKHCQNSTEDIIYIGVNNCNYKPDKTNKTSCNDTTHFYCSKSKTCIRKEWVCDGSLHCKEGEDEDFELCEDKFPEGATIQCIEGDRPVGIEITILAVPCNNVLECIDGKDENDCHGDWKHTFIPVLITIYSMFGLFSCFYMIKKRQILYDSSHLPGEEIIIETIIEEYRNEFKVKNCWDLKGDQLAKLKV